jgi:hypothetical protein
MTWQQVVARFVMSVAAIMLVKAPPFGASVSTVVCAIVFGVCAIDSGIGDYVRHKNQQPKL